jgi:transcription initiation factor TFIIB
MITDQESGEVVCGSCGLVSPDKMLDGRPEWRTSYPENNGNRQRIGPPNSLSFYDMGLSTTIGKGNKDYAGHRLDASANFAMQRLRIWDTRSRVRSSHRSLMQAFGELDRLKEKLCLSEGIVEKAAYIYRKAQEKELIRGRTISSILAAAIYMACREMGAPRSIHDVVKITNVRSKALSRDYKVLVLELDIKVPLIDPEKYVAQIANKVKVSEKTKRIAIEMVKEIVRKEISAGKNPIGFAAAALYLSCLSNNENKTQRDISEAAGITDVTIRNRMRDLNVGLGLE